MSNVFKCTPRQARKMIVQCIQAGLVPYLQSSPGMGKSSIVRSIAKEFQLELLDERLSTRESVDLSGFAMLNEEKTRARYVPLEDLVPIEGMDEIPAGKQGWLLFMDEFNAAERPVQAASYKLILDREVGRHKVHSHVAMVLAGNLSTDRAITNPLSTAMQSRLVHIEMDVSFKEWLEDVALPEEYDSRVIAFLSQYNDKLMDFRPDHQEKTFCCPRTWEFVNRLIKGNSVDDDMAILLSGTITSGVAMEFAQFTKIYNHLITKEEIVQDPANCRLPADNSLMWATITHMAEKVDDKLFQPFSTYADRFELPFRILFYRMLMARKPELRSHPAFGQAVGKITKYLHE